MKLSYLVIFLSYSFFTHGQIDPNSFSTKHKKLFEFIKLPKYPGMPLLTTEAEKFKLSLSLEILNRINTTDPREMNCLISDLTDRPITSYHLEIISEMLDRYDYHESGYVPCKASSKILSVDDLKEIESAIWENPLLKNEFPSAYCRGRAYLTSKILDDLGYKSKMLNMKGNIFGAYKVKAGYKVATYLEHFVNIVEVKKNDKITEYVLDPMFTDGPLPLQEYIKLTSIPVYETPSYNIKHQTYADKLAPPLQDESCKYNLKLLEDYQSALKESLNNPSPLQGGNQVYNSVIEAKDAQVKALQSFKP